MARATYTPHYAVNLDLRGVPVLIVGGGEVANRKLESLLESGADVTVVEPERENCRAVEQLCRRLSRRCRLLRRHFRSSDLKGQRLVFMATHDRKLNQRVAKMAHKRGVWVNVAAPGEAGSFHVPASVRRGRIGIAISTGGASAALARTLRQKIEKSVGEEWGELAALLELRRPRVLKKIRDEKKRHDLLCKLGAQSWAALIRKRGVAYTARKMDEMIKQAGERNGAGGMR